MNGFLYIFLQVLDYQLIKLSNLGENKYYEVVKKCVEDLVFYLKLLSGGKGKFIRSVVLLWMI